jgi:amino acid transporter
LIGKIMQVPPATESAPKPALSLWDAMTITIGIVIGAGIFQTPAIVAGDTGSVSGMMGAWLLGGLLSLVGALTYAELATAYPSAGGDYAFLTRAFGKHVSFLFAWARSGVIVTGSIALLGFVLGDYLTRIWNLGPYSSAIYAATSVILLTALNLSGLKRAARLQNLLTILEIGGVLLVAGAALSLRHDRPVTTAALDQSHGAFGLAMVFVLLTYGGWNEAAYVSAEVRGGARTMVRTLVLSITAITFIYLLFVAAVTYGLGFSGLKGSEAVGVEIMDRAFGTRSAILLAAIVTCSALTSMNSTMIAGARTNYALAHDWRIFSFMGGWRSENNLPLAGFLIQAAVALSLIAFGAVERNGFSAMVEFTAPVFWLFFMLIGLSLFVLRRKEPSRARPFRAPWYPVLPAVFVATCAYLLYSSIVYAQSRHATYIALVVMISGMMVWIAIRKRG